MSPSPGPKRIVPGQPGIDRRRANSPWKWNGERRSDPKLPSLEEVREVRPWRVLGWALMGCLLALLAMNSLF